MKYVSLILFPQFQMLAYVLATETLRIANKYTGSSAFSWQTRTATNAPVAASNGAFVSPDTMVWSDRHAPDLVLLCAGYDPLDHITARVRSYLSRADQAGATLGGVDTGTVILAELGLLDGHQSVLHHAAEAGFRETWPNIAVSDAIYCLDGRRLTAAGGTATGDALLAWLDQVHSADLAAAVSDGIAHGAIRSPEERQCRPQTADPVLTAMNEVMQRHLSELITIGDLCKSLGISTKHLRRRCVRTYGVTPLAHYLRLRLGLGFSLLKDTHLSVTEISVATGFASASAFSRAFKHRFEVSPTRLRHVRKYRNPHFA